MENIYGLIISIIYILIVLGIGTFLAKYQGGESELSRKIIHILVGNWVFITPVFTELWALVLVPFTFIIVNSLSLKYNFISAMEREDDSLGTVYYALSLFILSALGFLLDWKSLPFIGVLTMAYGDGLAAIIGQKWGKAKPFPFAGDKSLLGTIIVAVTSFIVTSTVLSNINQGAQGRNLSLYIILLIGLVNAVLSAYIELTGKKGSDNLTLPLGSAIFASLAYYFTSSGLLIYLLISLAILVLAYKKRSITHDGIVAALLTAICLYSLGGPYLGASLLVFFILGSIISKFTNTSKSKAVESQEGEEARNWVQVVCNSLPATVLVWLYHIYPEKRIYLLLAFGVFSSAAADTFASEIGMLNKGKVYNILTLKEVANGLSGGVSFLGFLAGGLGSFILSLLSYPEFGIRGIVYISIIGFIGSILDSIIGASLQRKYRGEDGSLQDRNNSPKEKPSAGYIFISNNIVNLLTLSITPLLGHLILQ